MFSDLPYLLSKVSLTPRASWSLVLLLLLLFNLCLSPSGCGQAQLPAWTGFTALLFSYPVFVTPAVMDKVKIICPYQRKSYLKEV